MSDHIPDTGKMVSDRVVMLRTIAAILDHPNVYMGGPSQRNMRRAEQIYAAVAPLIAAAERERCAREVDCGCLNRDAVLSAETKADRWRACPRDPCGAVEAAAIRALYRGEAGR